MAQQIELNFRDYWRIVRKRRWVIVASIFLCTAVSLLTVHKEVPVYQAVAKIKVEQRTTVAEALLQASIPSSPGDLMENYARVIEGRPVAELAAKRLGLLKPEMTDSEGDGAIDEVQGSISTARVTDTNLIQILATHTDPQKASDIANAIAESFVEWDLLEKNKAARKTKEFIETQLGDVQEKLRLLEDKLAAMRGFSHSADPTSPSVSQLATLKAELTELSFRATEKHPHVVRLKEEIRRLKEELKQVPGGGDETEYTRLKRDIALHEQLYTLFKQKFEEARISEAEKVSDISIVDYARSPGAPMGGGRTMNTLFGGVIGLLLGFVVAFVTENLDTSMSTIEDVEAILAVPVLSVIPHVTNETRPTHFWQRLGTKESPELDRKARLVVHNDPKSPMAEAYRSLRTNLKFGAGPNGRSLVVTSTNPREGKTAVLVNLGLTTAQMGSRTLLVESDLRRPTVSRTFQIPREPGLSEVLSGAVKWQECVRGLSDFLLGGMALDEAAKTPGLDHLFILTAGQIPSNPAELLGSEEMGLLIEELKQHFDVILYDAPPILPITDAALLAPKTDGTLLVYEVGRTARSALSRAKSQIISVGGQVVGVVLTHIKSEAEGGADYGAYYHYRYYGSEKESEAEDFLQKRPKGLRLNKE